MNLLRLIPRFEFTLSPEGRYRAWLHRQRARHDRINGPTVEEKARQLAAEVRANRSAFVPANVQARWPL
jgi:hypothetical protein